MSLYVYFVYFYTHARTYVRMHAYMCVSLSIYVPMYVSIYMNSCQSRRAARSCQPSADAERSRRAGEPRAPGRENAGRSAGAAGPPAAPESRSGDVSGFPSDRRAGASQSLAPVRRTRTWEGDRPAIPCLSLSFRPLCSTFPSDPWLGLIFFPPSSYFVF